MFKLPEEYVRQLADMKMSYKLMHYGGVVQRDKNDKIIKDEDRQPMKTPEKIVCRVICMLSKETVCLAEGTDEMQTTMAAIDKARTSDRPLTPGQLVVQNRELQERVKNLEAQSAPKRGKPSTTPAEPPLSDN